MGFAPVHPDEHETLVEVMEGVEDIPGSALSEGMTWGWETFGEYLDTLDSQPHALDIGTQVPHAALRAYTMGDRSRDGATADDIARMTTDLPMPLVPERWDSRRAGPPATVMCAGRRCRDLRANDELTALVGSCKQLGAASSKWCRQEWVA